MFALFIPVLLILQTINSLEYSTNLSVCPIIQTTLGLIQGTTVQCGEFCEYCRYAGIPYAEPPLENLRFKAPVPHSGWEPDILDATEHRNYCPNTGRFGTFGGEEDCLFVNVFADTIDMEQIRPVMVWIHGGGFSEGSGNSDMHGPTFIVQENVLLVTLNYRLGVLGFFSTGDKFAPGNYALKDVVLALKWVKDNIRNFGGDPDNVTIFGESAGGAMVHYLILSPMATGLFSRAISQSGSAISFWPLQPNPEAIAHELATNLGIDFSDNEDLVNQMRNIPVSDLIAVTHSIEQPIPSGLYPIPFGPCIEPDNIDGNERFLHDYPRNILLSGDYNRVPYITGFNIEEFLNMVIVALYVPDILNVINAEPHRLIPPHWHIDASSPIADEIANEIIEFYFHGEQLSPAVAYEFSIFHTDLLFITGIVETARLHAQIQRQPVYLYQFSYDGDLNMEKIALNLPQYPGAVHADDMYYLFDADRIPSGLNIKESSLMTRRRMVRMWTNFAKFGNPTIRMDEITTTRWMPVRSNEEFLHINDTLTLETFPLRDRVSFWRRLQDKYVDVLNKK